MSSAHRARARRLIELVEDAGYEPQSYSGRGMFGSRCVAVTLDRGASPFSLAIDIALVVADGEEPGDMELLESIRRPHQDSMGMGTVVYWPRIPWPEHDEDPPEPVEPEHPAMVTSYDEGE